MLCVLGNMDKNLKTKTNVFMSLDAGLSWRQVASSFSRSNNFTHSVFKNLSLETCLCDLGHHDLVRSGRIFYEFVYSIY